MQGQGDLFESTDWQEVRQGKLFYQPNFLSQQEADTYFSTLMSTLATRTHNHFREIGTSTSFADLAWRCALHLFGFNHGTSPLDV